MLEIWKDINNYEGLYQVSNTGLVRSFHSGNNRYKTKSHVLKPFIENNGYYAVSLYKNKHKKKFLIHRLVAEHFLSNSNDYPCVNHKDENRLNNNVDNLEWCTYLYNNRYGTSRIRQIETCTSYSVEQFTLSGHWLATYLNCSVIEKMFGYQRSSIRDCCNGKVKTAYGYLWRYTDYVPKPFPNK